MIVWPSAQQRSSLAFCLANAHLRLCCVPARKLRSKRTTTTGKPLTHRQTTTRIQSHNGHGLFDILLTDASPVRPRPSVSWPWACSDWAWEWRQEGTGNRLVGSLSTKLEDPVGRGGSVRITTTGCVSSWMTVDTAIPSRGKLSGYVYSGRREDCLRRQTNQQFRPCRGNGVGE